MDKFLKKKEILKITGLSEISIWRLEKNGKFPKRRMLCRGRVGWLESEIQEWIDSRPSCTS